MRRFWAIRRIDRDYVEPTLYKSEAAARSAAASRRGYDVLALFSETEARSAKATAPVGRPSQEAVEAVFDRFESDLTFTVPEAAGAMLSLFSEQPDCTHPACPLKAGGCATAWGRTEPFEDCPSVPTPPKAEADHG